MSSHIGYLVFEEKNYNSRHPMMEEKIFCEDVLTYLSFSELLSVREVNETCKQIFVNNNQIEVLAKRLLRRLHSTNLLVNAVASQHETTINKTPISIQSSHSKQKPLCIAHKGTTEDYEGNTIPAFQEAMRIGVDMIELDVITCSTGNLIIFHDPYLPCGELVSETSISTIKSKYPSIPTLKEILEVTAKSPVRLYFDLKSPNLAEPLMNEILSTVHRWKCDPHKYLVASFDHHDLLEVDAFRATYSELEGVETIVIVDSMPIGLSKPFEELGARYISIAQGRITSEFVKDAHRRKMGVLAWTVNNQNLIVHFLKIGVDGIVTDLPKSVLKLIEEETTSRETASRTDGGHSKLPAAIPNASCDAETFIMSLYPEGILSLRRGALDTLAEIEPIVKLSANRTLEKSLSCIFAHSDLLQKISQTAEKVEMTMKRALHPHLLSEKTFDYVFSAMMSHPEGVFNVRKPACMKKLFDFETNWLYSITHCPSS